MSPALPPRRGQIELKASTAHAGGLLFRAERYEKVPLSFVTFLCGSTKKSNVDAGQKRGFRVSVCHYQQNISRTTLP